MDRWEAWGSEVWAWVGGKRGDVDAGCIGS